MNRPEGFAPIPTWMLRDKTVSRRACLVYASLSSRSGLGAIFPSQATIAEEAGVSERTVRSALTELEQLGVVERISRRGREGRATGMTNAYVLRPNGRYEEPADIAARPKGPAKRPATSDDADGNGPQPLLYKAEIEEAEKEAGELSAELLVAVSFEDFWAVWPKKVAKPDAQRAWDKVTVVVEGERILAAAIAYRDNPGIPERQFIPYPATWLNRAGWDDELPAPRQDRLGAVDAGRRAAEILAEHDRLAVGA